MQQSANTEQNESQKEIAAKAGYLTASDAAWRAGVNITTIYRLINRKKIKAVKMGRQQYVLARSLALHYGAIKEIFNRIMAGVQE